MCPTAEISSEEGRRDIPKGEEIYDLEEEKMSTEDTELIYSWEALATRKKRRKEAGKLCPRCCENF